MGKRMLLAIADSHQHKGFYDLCIQLDGLELNDILDRVAEFYLQTIEEGEEYDNDENNSDAENLELVER